MSNLIHWLKKDEFTKILGIPFWMQGDENPFWEALYLKIKKRSASWTHQEHVSPHGVQLANLIVYGIPDPDHAPPSVVRHQPHQRCQKLIWDRTIETDVTTLGSTRTSKAWMIDDAISNAR
jgi:hypothetical protein